LAVSPQIRDYGCALPVLIGFYQTRGEYSLRAVGFYPIIIFKIKKVYIKRSKGRIYSYS
jgi:hypothetical protein